jgi:nucleoid-associated protein YgaU
MAEENDAQRAQHREEARKLMEEQMKASLGAAKKKFIAEHTLTSEETLSHLSLKYYGSATKPYWMVIYEANKDVIGDNPNRVHSGMVLKIPELPPNLEKK